MRLDRFITECLPITRKEAKDALKSGRVTFEGKPLKDGSFHVKEEEAEIYFDGKKLEYQKFVYYLLYKPLGVVTATEDSRQETVMDLMRGAAGKNLFPVGRLDKDTDGLLLITNDGKLGHDLLAPGKHVPKTYYATLRDDLSEEDRKRLEEGVDIGDEKMTLPAVCRSLSPREIHLTVYEGRYHQVRRMLEAVGNQVVTLRRITFGSLKLDQSLQPGDYRVLTEEEVAALRTREG